MLILPVEKIWPPVLRLPPLTLPAAEILPEAEIFPAAILPALAMTKELPTSTLAVTLPDAVTDTTLIALVQTLTPSVPSLNRSLVLVPLPRFGSA